MTAILLCSVMKKKTHSEMQTLQHYPTVKLCSLFINFFLIFFPAQTGDLHPSFDQRNNGRVLLDVTPLIQNKSLDNSCSGLNIAATSTITLSCTVKHLQKGHLPQARKLKHLTTKMCLFKITGNQMSKMCNKKENFENNLDFENEKKCLDNFNQPMLIEWQRI